MTELYKHDNDAVSSEDMFIRWQADMANERYAREDFLAKQERRSTRNTYLFGFCVSLFIAIALTNVILELII